MNEVKRVHGVLWNDGVVCNARWAGARLRDVLLAVGVEPDAATARLRGWHVCFSSHVTPCQDDKDYGGSIPLETAMNPEGDVLLAYEVRPDSCARVVVPGIGDR